MTKGHVKAVVGIAATAFFLYLALRGVHWGEVGRELRRADPLLLGAALVVATLGMHVRALRWKPLLEPIAPGVPWRPRIAAVFIGFGVNNVFPARLGEFARTWVLARQARVTLSGAFASLVLERVLDAIVCIGFLLGVMALPSFPAMPGGGGVDPQAAARVIGGAMGVALLMLLALAAAPHRAVAVAERVAGWVLPAAFRRPFVDALRAFLGGLDVLRSPRLLAISAAWAVFQWLFLAVSFWLAFLAFGITEPGFTGALFLQSLVALAVAVPAAPGFFGPWEAAARWGLGLWGVDASLAISFAIAFHIGGWLTVTLGGLYYAARLNIRLRELGRSEARVEEAVENDPEMQRDAAGV